MTTALDADENDPLVLAYLRLIRAFNANDLASAKAAFDPKVVYTIPGRSPVASVAHGVDEHLAQLKRVREASGGTLKFEPKSVVAKNDLLFVYGRVSAVRGEKRLDSDHLVLFRFASGLIVEGRTVPLDLYEFDAFWA